MQPDRWKTIEEVFHAALQRPVDDRPAYLDDVCKNDPELRREVESLLVEAIRKDSFMDQPAAGLSLSQLEPHIKAPLEGRFLNHYKIGPLAGSGGMADVYRARDTRLHRDVAIKVLHDAQSMSVERRQRMYREARLLASFSHPNIAAIYGIEEAGEICGLILEWIEGEVLSERISRGPLSIAETLRLAKQIAAGMEAAHEKGIIHRDLKPSNIKITPAGIVKVIDFGIAKIIQPVEAGTQTAVDLSTRGAILGTVAYMSPEQARGKPVDTRTDIWAFGCVLYEMLTAKPAFQGDTPTDIIIKIATEEPDWTPIPKFPEATSVDLARIVRKCMQKNPDMRYQSVRDIAIDLESVREGSQPPSSNEEEFVVPGRFAPTVFLLAQAGYLALYGAALFYIEAIGRILDNDFVVPERIGLIVTIVLAMCGIAVRLYLISAVGWRHPAARRKFTLLFPLLLILDGIWAASPLLLWRKIGYGLALAGVALLAYVPFAQRTLLHAIYPTRRVEQ